SPRSAVLPYPTRFRSAEGRPVDPLVRLELCGIPGEARLEVDRPGEVALGRDVPNGSLPEVQDAEVPLGQGVARVGGKSGFEGPRSEEHTSELQSQDHL